MKQIKNLTAGAVTIGLLLGASTVQATTVILDGNSVVGIEDLAVTNQLGDVAIFDVEFLTTTAAALYGVDLVPQLKDENAMLARIAITNALNANTPIPTAAGTASTDQYFIGAFQEEATMVAVGGEFESRAPDEWGWCRIDCLPFGVRVMLPDEFATYASFSPVPVPAAVWLFGSGLLGLIGIARRKTITEKS
ncbi:MAG: hypothetical protein QNL62_12790 [Gammaproteobacteria bacterium]|nr:hypothetical protein [Gammaproteobacteria bacterium]